MLVTTAPDRERVKLVRGILDLPENNFEPEPPTFSVADIKGKGLGLAASGSLRRGTALMSHTPVIMVHKRFVDEVDKEEQERILEAAVKLLPAATREKFDKERAIIGSGASARDIILSRPFLSDLGLGRNQNKDEEEERHYLNFPEATTFSHDCRPNVAYHIDSFYHIFHAIVIRKAEPGEELTISYVDPMLPRAQRQHRIRHWRKADCKCAKCTGNYSFKELEDSDARLAEIQTLQAELGNHENLDVTTDMVDRLLELYKIERLESRIAAAYEIAALTYNNLGLSKKAQKFANRARLAWLIEMGPDSNEAIAMRIFAEDPEGHYSYKAKVKGKKTPST